MSISTIVRSAVVVACVGALPIYGQYGQSKAPAKKSTPTAQTSTTGMPAATDTTGTMSTTTTKTTSTTKTRHPSGGTNRTRVWNDATRLAAILTDAQDTKVTFSADAWRVTANEANMLANRIYASSGGRSPAGDLRKHIREMRDAALKGDADGARSHASLAMPFATQLIDWSMPK
jgi:cytoskeletal protein RodZ